MTRSDFDGLVCGVLLREAGIIDSWKFIHPKDMQDGLIEVGSNDVLANVPFVPGCGLWFDHHSSEQERMGRQGTFNGSSKQAPSAARVIYDYYKDQAEFGHLEDLLLAVDKVDSGQLTVTDILDPQGWVLLGFIMDPRTGLGRFQDYRISNYTLMEDLIESCRVLDAEHILMLPDVRERVKRYEEQTGLFKDMIAKYTRVEGNIMVTDLRGADNIYSGNRFLIYSLYPQQNVSIWVVDGRGKQNCVFAVGHSIINRGCKTDVGSLMLRYDGGGHQVVGTCQVPYADADKVMAELIAELMEN